MPLPFSPAEFLSVFERLDRAIGIAPSIAYGWAATALVLVCARAGRATDAVAAGMLAASWIFTGAVYFLGFFRAIAPAVAVVAGTLFVVQGALFAFAAARGRLRFVAMRSPGAWLGAALVLYAAIVYPVLGAAIGHVHPRAPSFGVTPCPTTLFTWGLLLFTAGTIPRWLLPIPFLWSFVGLSAAVSFGMVEDFALPIAAVLATAVLLSRSTAATPAEQHAAMPGDALIPAPIVSLTHAIELPAPAARVFPWLAQMGAGRAGWYSYDRIDNGGFASVRRIVPAWQDVKPGDVFPALPGATDAFLVASVEPPGSLVLHVPGPDPRGPSRGSWSFLVCDAEHGRSRLVVRGRLGPRTAAAAPARERRRAVEVISGMLDRLPDAIFVPLAAMGHRVMQVHQLRNLRRRVAAAEAAPRERGFRSATPAAG